MTTEDQPQRLPARFPLGARAILFDALLATVIAVALIAAREWFERYTMLGQQLELSAYNWLQLVLASKRTEDKLPIVIVDLSDLETETIRGERKGEKATPREPLKTLLKEIADLKPRAIGVDVDFSPNVFGDSASHKIVFITPEDSKFFDSCLKLFGDTGVPIYLGIKRTEALPRWQWLLRPEYEILAASILAPRFETTQEMLQCFHSTTERQCGPTMSEALAQHLPPAPSRLIDYFPWLVKSDTQRKFTETLYAGTFPVDYSQLERLESGPYTISNIQPETITTAAPQIAGSVVLMGDANPDVASDKFIIPGRGDPVAGVYVHACAIYTLSQAPLYSLTRPGRWFVDLGLTAIVIFALVVIRYRFLVRRNAEVKLHWLQSLLMFVVVFAAIIISTVWVHRTRVLWTDSPLVAVALLVHPSCERCVKTVGSWLRRAFSRLRKEQH